MPVGALVVGHRRIDGAVVEVEDFVAGIALVELRHPVFQRDADGGTVALGDDVDAVVGGLLRLNQGFLRVALVIEWDNLDLLAVQPPGRIDFIGQEVESLQAAFAGRGAAARQRIDVADLDRVLRQRGRRRKAQRQRAASQSRFHHFAFLPQAERTLALQATGL